MERIFLAMMRKGLTLMESMVAVILLIIIVVGLYSINSFSHFQVISSSRRARVQNEATLAMQYVTKELVFAAGNEVISGPDSVVRTGADAQGEYLSFRVDTDSNGIADQWRGFRRMTGNVLSWCPQCTTDTCGACVANNWTQLASNVTAFSVTKAGNPLRNNYVNVTVSACFNAAAACGTIENPDIHLRANVELPQVSTN